MEIQAHATLLLLTVSTKYPFDKIAGGKSLWDQPGVRAAMRAAMGKRFFELSQKEMHGAEGPVASDGRVISPLGHARRMIAATIRYQMTVFFDCASGSAQVCWRSSTGNSGKAQDLWLADGRRAHFRPMPAVMPRTILSRP